MGPPSTLGMSPPSCFYPAFPPPPPQCFSSVPAPASFLPKLLFINTDQNILLPAETHMAMVLPSHTLPSTHSHALFAAVKAVLNHTVSPAPANTAVPPLLGIGPSISHNTHLLHGFFSMYVCIHGGCTHLGLRSALPLPSNLGCQSHILLLCDLGQLT